MPDSTRVIEVSDYEHRLMVHCIMTARNDYIDEGTPTEDVNKLMVKVIDAPTKKQKRKERYSAGR